MWDHRVMNRALFPGAGFMELAVCGAHMMGGSANAMSRGEIAIVGAVVPVPLVLPGGATVDVVTMEWRTDSGGETIEVASAAARVTPHLRARARRIQMPTPAPAAAYHQSSLRSLDLLYRGGGGLSPPSPPPPTRRSGVATGTIQETDGNGFTPCEKTSHQRDPNLASIALTSRQLDLNHVTIDICHVTTISNQLY
jgi:hypothetical protein